MTRIHANDEANILHVKDGHHPSQRIKLQVLAICHEKLKCYNMVVSKQILKEPNWSITPNKHIRQAIEYAESRGWRVAKHRAGNNCPNLNVAAVARPQGIDVLANVATTAIYRTMLRQTREPTFGGGFTIRYKSGMGVSKRFIPPHAALKTMQKTFGEPLIAAAIGSFGKRSKDEQV